MKVFYDKVNLPIKMWLDDVEAGAMEQAKNLSRLPFAFRQIALMPDCHQGYGMPIGGVLATQNCIIPNAVGVDIGCGMRAVKTNLQNIDKDVLKIILGEIRKAIPVGFKHNEVANNSAMPRMNEDLMIVETEIENAKKQIGSLGGGNHFIEIQKGDDGYIWIMVHSGSRNIGYKVAQYYNKRAMVLNELWLSGVPKEWELAFLPEDTDEGLDYIAEMKYCVMFAKKNRELMVSRIKEIIKSSIIAGDVEFEDDIDVAHNYARLENHFGKNVWVHRKGATSARENEIGIIPGSQGTKSYIVKGLGNPESFMSCSHGAGRKMSRTKARENLDLKKQIAILDNAGIIHGIRHKTDLDEAPDAYKNIQEVMENQKDLIEIVTELTPLAVIKG